MKKHLLIAAGLVGAVSIQSQSAMAVTKCVALDGRTTTCTSDASSYNDKIDWAATCTTNGVSTPISGIGVCSATKSTALGAQATELEITGTADNNIYCWCRMISPAVSSWVFGGSSSSYMSCSMGCAGNCAGTLQHVSSFLGAMFSSLSD